MTLDEAIKHCEEVAEDRAGCAEDCVEEHRQLAEWLKELKRLRAVIDNMPKQQSEYTFSSLAPMHIRIQPHGFGNVFGAVGGDPNEMVQISVYVSKRSLAATLGAIDDDLK